MIPEPVGWQPPARWLSVWLTGQADLPSQLGAGGYLTATAEDTAAVPPAVAAHAVGAYSRPGDTVYDPDCGAGTVCVEALRAGRHAVGLTGDPDWWELARRNVTAVKASGAAGDGTVLDRPPSRRSWTGLVRPADLVLTTIRPPTPTGRTLVPAEGADATWSGQLRAVLSAYQAVARPGGRLVVVTRPGLAVGEPADPASTVVVVGSDVGLVPAERCVALVAALHDDTVVVHPALSGRQPTPAPAGRSGALAAHLDVVVFRCVGAGGRSARLAAPDPPSVAPPLACAGGLPRTRRTRRAA